MKQSKFYYTEEMVAFINDYKSNHSIQETVIAFNEKFKTNKNKHNLESLISDIKNGHRKVVTDYEMQNMWLVENYNKYSNNELVKNYNKKFNANVGRRSLENRTSKMIQKGLIVKSEKRPIGRFVHTQEHIDWIVAHKSRYTTKELLEQFRKEFNHSLSYGAMKSMLYRNNIKFKENNICSKFDLDRMFIKYKIGDIVKTNVGNYIKIKNEPYLPLSKRNIRCKNSNYERYDKWLYEKQCKVTIPEGKCILHINGDMNDDRLENLKLVDKSIFRSIYRRKYLFSVKGLVEANIMAKEIEKEIEKYEKNY